MAKSNRERLQLGGSCSSVRYITSKSPDSFDTNYAVCPPLGVPPVPVALNLLLEPFASAESFSGRARENNVAIPRKPIAQWPRHGVLSLPLVAVGNVENLHPLSWRAADSSKPSIGYIKAHALAAESAS